MVNKKRLLVLQPSLAPYRVDLYNFLSERFIFHVILYNPNLDGLAFEKESVEKSALFKFIKLSGGITIGSQVLSVKLIDPNTCIRQFNKRRIGAADFYEFA